MVNRLWCEAAIPILWRKPWYYAINYRNKVSLFSIITSYLSNDVKEFLTEKGIKVSNQSLVFDYLSFCKSININVIDDIISIEWEDRFDEMNDDEPMEDPYTEIFEILKKHAITLNHFEISLQLYSDKNYTVIHFSILEFYNLKTLKISSPVPLSTFKFDEKLETVVYRNLEIFEVDSTYIYQVTCMIKNSPYLRELRIHDYILDDNEFNDDTLNLIRVINENCFLIEHLSIPVFPLLENHLTEFGKLLKKCQKLRLLQFRKGYYEEGKELEFGENLLDVLARETSTSLRRIEISHYIIFSLKAFETFLEKWKGQPAITILMDEFYFCQNDDSYKKLISKYKNEGVIKDINM
ncbi:hypothetical protein RclHR1_01700002 [Rhizophagus clarus]|uniref:F-box domain-containing protein n=1 Tax=Rhizophagus clarus TaxID=94130 RepID=A0A2Z6QWJ0_9GLOM|nr:hypothetical protein RclHR1_01700002 [Rhizophagus clarus]